MNKKQKRLAKDIRNYDALIRKSCL